MSGPIFLPSGVQPSKLITTTTLPLPASAERSGVSPDSFSSRTPSPRSPSPRAPFPAIPAQSPTVVDEDACAEGKQKAADPPRPPPPVAPQPQPQQPKNLHPYSVRALGFERILQEHKVACVYDWSGAGADHIYVPLVIDDVQLSMYVSAAGGSRPSFTLQIVVGRCKPGAPRDYIVCEGLVELNRNVLFGAFYRNFTNGEIGYRLVHPLLIAGSATRSVDDERLALFWSDFETAIETVRHWLPVIDELMFASQYSAKEILTTYHLSRMSPSARATAVARMRAEQMQRVQQEEMQQQQQEAQRQAQLQAQMHAQQQAHMNAQQQMYARQQAQMRAQQLHQL